MVGPNVWTTKRKKIKCIQTDAAGSDQSQRAIVETLMRFFMVVAVEVVGRSSLQLYHRVILSEIDVPSFGAVPKPFEKKYSKARPLPSMVTWMLIARKRLYR